jgi:hypothetical protein
MLNDIGSPNRWQGDFHTPMKSPTRSSSPTPNRLGDVQNLMARNFNPNPIQHKADDKIYFLFIQYACFPVYFLWDMLLFFWVFCVRSCQCVICAYYIVPRLVYVYFGCNCDGNIKEDNHHVQESDIEMSLERVKHEKFIYYNPQCPPQLDKVSTGVHIEIIHPSVKNSSTVTQMSRSFVEDDHHKKKKQLLTELFHSQQRKIDSDDEEYIEDNKASKASHHNDSYIHTQQETEKKNKLLASSFHSQRKILDSDDENDDGDDDGAEYKDHHRVYDNICRKSSMAGIGRQGRGGGGRGGGGRVCTR